MTRQESSASARAANVEGSWRYKDQNDEDVTYDSGRSEGEYLRGYRSVKGFAKANDGGVTGRVGTDDGLVAVAWKQVGCLSRQCGRYALI